MAVNDRDLKLEMYPLKPFSFSTCSESLHLYKIMYLKYSWILDKCHINAITIVFPEWGRWLSVCKKVFALCRHALRCFVFLLVFEYMYTVSYIGLWICNTAVVLNSHSCFLFISLPLLLLWKDVNLVILLIHHSSSLSMLGQCRAFFMLQHWSWPLCLDGL